MVDSDKVNNTAMTNSKNILSISKYFSGEKDGKILILENIKSKSLPVPNLELSHKSRMDDGDLTRTTGDRILPRGKVRRAERGAD